MRSPRLAALELKRFGRGRLPRAAMVAMLLLPLLYGALYLWSFWNPYGRLDKVPVALVNEDAGAHADGKQIAAGDSVAEGLRDSGTFDWHETDAADARKGVEDGRYYLSLTVPADFSKRIASSSGDDPRTGALKVRTNDANNYVVGQMSRTVFSEVRAAASSKASRGFYDRIFVSFSTLHDRTAKAADGADELGDGIGRAKKGTGELKDGLGEAGHGSGRLKDGTSRLHAGAGKLEKGSKQVADGTQKLTDKVDKAAAKLGPFLDGHEDEIGTAARDVARASKTLKENLHELPAAAQKAETDSRKAARTLRALYRARCEGPLELDTSCPQLKKAVDAAETAADVAKDVNDVVKKQGGLTRLGERLDELRRYANALADRAPHLGQDLDKAVAQVHALNDGAHKVHDGAGRLNGGLASAESGAASLDAGVGKLGKGAGALDGGMYKLADGSSQLSGGLHDGVKKIPDYGKQERGDRADVMSDPVGLASSSAHEAPNYGTGFAPYFIPLALWVGAMIAYMLLQPLNRRALAAGAPAARITLAGWLPVAAIGAAQAAALLSVLHWGLGLQLARGAGTVGFLLLVTSCFTAIVQFLGARFGPAGRVLVLAMLMLQLTSAGGTYPIQTSPGFFNAVHPFLPMSYVVDGLRHLITGGDVWPVWRACLVLLAFTAGALALTAVTARRRRVWTVDRLHPEIAL
ncbi:YhgE/Pip domain-containing protein [Streptomyces sp. HNM0575]|uniref:YhgE/Pip family protein n=1 Tax=Streptomyces sp. HNM0575 TaxID=2716338 RepID=UPI00145EB1C7|nr:YhgE/Pip domain-containing protein [Streptomyces sp. HNM0575]NLU74556.1 YhgE/Pip domain-containing protein [Streptomyces sp. HNM0575]